MSEIEFLIIPLSLVVGLAFVRFLDGLWIVVDSPNRYWVHAVWTGNKYVQSLFAFWSLVGLLRGKSLSGFGFSGLLLLLAPPTILYLQALALVGRNQDDSTGRNRDWESHFFEVRLRFFSLNIVLALTTALASWMNIVGNEANPYPFIPLAAISVVGLFTSNRAVHAFLAIGNLFFLAFAIPRTILNVQIGAG